MSKLVAVDPGKTSGLVIFEIETGEVVVFGQMTKDEMIEFTNTYEEDVAVVVVEDYIIFKKRALQQAGSKVEAAQVIGMMHVFAHKKGAKFIKQPADNKTDGARLSQKFPPKDHSMSHQVDAYNHGYFRLYQMGKVKSALEKERLG